MKIKLDDQKTTPKLRNTYIKGKYIDFYAILSILNNINRPSLIQTHKHKIMYLKLNYKKMNQQSGLRLLFLKLLFKRKFHIKIHQ